jgi:hypothetical protein
LETIPHFQGRAIVEEMETDQFMSLSATSDMGQSRRSGRALITSGVSDERTFSDTVGILEGANRRYSRFDEKSQTCISGDRPLAGACWTYDSK